MGTLSTGGPSTIFWDFVRLLAIKPWFDGRKSQIKAGQFFLPFFFYPSQKQSRLCGFNGIFSFPPFREGSIW
jgi:hypothetical protein